VRQSSLIQKLFDFSSDVENADIVFASESENEPEIAEEY
jgi:hypothetical protein